MTATVSTSGGGSPTGMVTFADNGVALASATLAASGTDTSTATYSTTFPAGQHSVVATFVFSYPFTGSTSSPVTITAGSAAPTVHPTSVTLSANPTNLQTSQSSTLTATVTAADGDPGVPTGSVQFKDNGQSLGTIALDDSGTATLTASGFVAGTNTITATYSGDSTHQTNTSSRVGISATAPPTLHPANVTLSANPSTVQTGQTETFTAGVSAADGNAAVPTGSVQFYDNNLPIGGSVALNGSGVATLTWTGFAAGSHTITAKYQGDSVYDHATSPTVGVTANAPPSAVATSITASISPNPIPNNGSATLTAHVQQVGSKVTPPQGSIVTFRNKANGSLIAQASLDANGNGTAAKSGWQAGHYDIVATYVGDATNLSSSAGFS
ncbi:MAG TPA: Ig-like domain-containing protein, partial [Gaiellaceae bacterium]|nr:Ig-like domain-containing protein [Gaiellaceae bacterium]